MTAGVAGTVYLLHFDRPFGHARHYTGWTSDLGARLADHAAGRGARLLAAARAAGVEWTVARTWSGTRARERQVKTQGGAARQCPLCRRQARAQRHYQLRPPGSFTVGATAHRFNEVTVSSHALHGSTDRGLRVAVGSLYRAVLRVEEAWALWTALGSALTDVGSRPTWLPADLPATTSAPGYTRPPALYTAPAPVEEVIADAA